jgi:Holliday junction resolvase RusA-like endonuclease
MMHGVNRASFLGTLEIMLDLPMPTSTNRLYGRGRKGVYRTRDYMDWIDAADMAVMAAKAYPKCKIKGPFEVEILLSIVAPRADGDNKIKALLDWLQSRDVIRNDSDCRRGSWEWVEPSRAPRGARVILRSLCEASS